MQIEYNDNGKIIHKRVKDDELKRIMNGLKVTQEEAIKIWLEDEGVIHNAEQEELCRKTAESDIMRTIHDAESEKVTQKKLSGKSERKKTVKEQPEKEYIIAQVAELLEKFAENVTIENKTKIVTFTYQNAPYKIDLTATRIKK